MRRGFWKGLTAVFLGLTLIPLIAQPADAARYRGRGWGGARSYGRTYRAYPRYGYGYRSVVPRVYSRGYNYNPGYYYGRGYPYGSGYGYGSGYSGYAAPAWPVRYYNFAVPML